VSSIGRLHVARVSQRDGAATRADGAVERKAKTRAGRRIIALRVCLPCLYAVYTAKNARAGEKEKNVHAREKKGAKSIPQK